MDLAKLREPELSEFINSYQAVKEEDFVDIVYQRFLGRSVSPEELKNWIREPAVPRQDVVIGVISSEEHASTQNYIDALQRAGESLCQAKEWINAIPVLEELSRRQPNRAIWHAQIGRCWQALSKTESALNDFEKAYELEPQSADFGAEYARVLFCEAQDIEALKTLGKLLPFSPHHLPTLMLLSIAYIYVGRVEEGHSFLVAIRKSDADYQRAVEDLNDWFSMMVMKRGAALKSQLNVAISTVENEIGQTLPSYYQSILNIDVDIETLKTHLHQYPQDYVSWVELGLKFYFKNDLSESERCYRNALRIDNKQADAYVQYSYLLNRIGQYDELKWVAEKLLSIDQASVVGKEYLEIANSKLNHELSHRLEQDVLQAKLECMLRFEEDLTKSKSDENRRVLAEEMRAGKVFLRTTPPYFNLEVTGSCNLNPPCVFCFAKNDSAVSYKKLDISLVENYGRFLERAYSVNDCSFGEPLSHPEFVNLVRKTCQGGETFSFSTNGLLLNKEKADALAAYGNSLQFNVSLNAATPETYYKLMGKDLNKTLANVDYYRTRVMEIHKCAPAIYSSMIVMQINKKEVLDFIRLSKEHGFKVARLTRPYWDNAEFSIRDYFGYRFDYRQEVLSIEESNEIAEAAKSLGTELGIKVHINWIPEGGYFEMFKEEGSSTPCPFPWKFIFAAEHNKMTVPCCYSDGSLGSLAAQSIDEIWNGETVTTMRKELLQGKIPAHCLKYHHGCPLIVGTKKPSC